MKERPIIFNGDMVRAVLSGQKTQTRRPVKPQPIFKDLASPPRWCWSGKGHTVKWVDRISPLGMTGDCHFGQPGDHLWVKETFYRYYPSETWPEPKALYKADGITLCDKDSEGKKQRWTPSTHMPRSLSRIILEITDIRVERVQNITSDGAIAEGAYEVRKVGDDIAHATWTMDGLDWRYDTPREAFAATWDSLYAARGLGWDVNPWVWVVTFKRMEEVCPE